MICQATKRGEPECPLAAAWIDHLDVLWCDAHALEVRRLGSGLGPNKLGYVANGVGGGT